MEKGRRSSEQEWGRPEKGTSGNEAGSERRIEQEWKRPATETWKRPAGNVGKTGGGNDGLRKECGLVLCGSFEQE